MIVPQNNQPSTNNQPLTIRGMFREHLAVTNRKPRTIESYVSALEQFYNFIQKSPLRCTANDILSAPKYSFPKRPKKDFPYKEDDY